MVKELSVYFAHPRSVYDEVNPNGVETEMIGLMTEELPAMLGVGNVEIVNPNTEEHKRGLAGFMERPEGKAAGGMAYFEGIVEGCGALVYAPCHLAVVDVGLLAERPGGEGVPAGIPEGKPVFAISYRVDGKVVPGSATLAPWDGAYGVPADIGAGVAKEIRAALKKGIPVFELDYRFDDDNTLVPGSARIFGVPGMDEARVMQPQTTSAFNQIFRELYGSSQKPSYEKPK